MFSRACRSLLSRLLPNTSIETFAESLVSAVELEQQQTDREAAEGIKFRLYSAAGFNERFHFSDLLLLTNRDFESATPKEARKRKKPIESMSAEKLPLSPRTQSLMCRETPASTQYLARKPNESKQFVRQEKAILHTTDAFLRNLLAVMLRNRESLLTWCRYGFVPPHIRSCCAFRPSFRCNGLPSTSCSKVHQERKRSDYIICPRRSSSYFIDGTSPSVFLNSII